MSNTVVNTRGSDSIFIFIRKYYTCECHTYYLVWLQYHFKKCTIFFGIIIFIDIIFFLSSFLKIVCYLGKSIPATREYLDKSNFPDCVKRPTTSHFMQHNNISYAIPKKQTESFVPTVVNNNSDCLHRQFVFVFIFYCNRRRLITEMYTTDIAVYIIITPTRLSVDDIIVFYIQYLYYRRIYHGCGIFIHQRALKG